MRIVYARRALRDIDDSLAYIHKRSHAALTAFRSRSSLASSVPVK